MTPLFSDARVVEAAANEIWPLGDLSSDAARGELLRDTGRALAAAVAALPREEMIEKMMEAVAAEFAACSNVTAERILVAIGLIPEHVTEEER